MRLPTKGGRVIDPANGVDEILDIRVQDGIHAKLKRVFGTEEKGVGSLVRRRIKSVSGSL